MDDSENIFVVRPGAGSWLFEEFNRLNAVFLDFPFLDVDLASKPKNATELRQKLVRSIELNQWLRGRQTEPAPSRDLNDYKGKTRRKRLGRYVGAIETLYYDLPVGTIIAAPGPKDVSDVMIGVISGPAKLSNGVLPYMGEEVPIRPVRWMGRRQKAAFPAAMRKRLATPNPVMILERSFREEALRVAFDQYVIDGRFAMRIQTEAADYSSLDDADIANFVNYVAGMLAVADGGGAKPHAVTATEALKALRQVRDRVPDLATNINSPGSLRLLSARVDPLTIAVVIAIALSGTTSPAADIKIVNSAGSKNDACVLEVSEQAKGAMSMMTFDDFQDQCQKLTEAAKNVRLKTSVKAKIKPKRK